MLDAIAVRRFRTLTLVTAITTYVLVVIGGVVRVTGSGLGCLDWPLCADPLQAEAAILEMLHRFVAGFVSVLVILVAIGAWKAYRQRRWIFRPALIGVGVLIAQILLGAITVWLKNAPYTVALHLGTALTLLACTTIVATAVRTEETPIGDWRNNRLLASSLASALFVFLLILVGAIVTGTNSALACLDWPLCQGQVLPDTTSPYVYIQFLHRLVALITSLVLLRTTIVAWRARERQHTAWVVAALILSLYVVQVTVGAGNVLLKLPLVLRGLHLALASAVWGWLVVLTVWAAQCDKSQRVGPAAAADGSLSARSGSAPAVGDVQPVTSQQNVQTRPQGKAMFGAYLLLVKPWITVLLLVTTFAAMLIAQRGLPPLPLVFFTLLGGALSASGASTINSYIDRDIAGRMSRTKRRRVPTQCVGTDQHLAFGLFLSVASFVILRLLVNLLAAICDTIGIWYSVVI